MRDIPEGREVAVAGQWRGVSIQPLIYQPAWLLSLAQAVRLEPPQLTALAAVRVPLELRAVFHPPLMLVLDSHLSLVVVGSGD